MSMRTIKIPSRSKTLNALLKLALERDLVLRSADGVEFVLTRVKGTRAFYVGESRDFEKEVEATGKNEELMEFLAKRKAKSKGKGRKGLSNAEVRRQLGL